MDAPFTDLRMESSNTAESIYMDYGFPLPRDTFYRLDQQLDAWLTRILRIIDTRLACGQH